MKIFVTIQRQYALLGIARSSHQSTQKYPINKRIFFGFSLLGYLTFSQFANIFHVASSFIEYMLGTCSTFSSIVGIACFAAIVFRRTTLFEGIENIEKLIDTRCIYPKSRRFFTKVNQQIDRSSEIVFTIVVKIILQFMILSKCIHSFVVYFSADAGRDSFQLPIPLWFPFDWKNPLGYLIAVIVEYLLIGYKFFIIACSLALLIGFYLLTISVTKEIQCILQSMNNKSQANKHRSNKLKALVSEYMQVHATIKHATLDFSNIFQTMAMWHFTWCLIAISGALLVIQVEILQHGNVMPVLLLILCGILALATVFIACEIGQRINDAFDEINSSIDQLNWYLFPIEIQRMLPAIIAIAQQPVSLECFGSIKCTRDVFKNVIHRAFSYFMVLRRLGV